MEKKYDLIVIGTGVAASTAASKCRAEGWSVAVVDSQPFGGTCPLRGCDPKKVLLSAAGLVDRYTRAGSERIVASGGVEPSWRELIRFKRSFTEPVPQAREKSFADSGIETFHGRARFVDKTTMEVGEDRLSAGKILIASGAKPRPLTLPGAEHVITSADFLELDTLPARILFIGGGYVSFELAHAAARFGAKPTILHRSARPLKRFEPDVVEHLIEASRDAGIDVRLETDVKAVNPASGVIEVQATSAGGDVHLETDLVVHGAGRVPEIDDLDLSRGDVQRDKGIVVNEHLQSVSNSNVYAAGDAAQTDGAPLTPVASYEGQVAAKNLLKPGSQETEYMAIPSVVFSVPPMASVGLRQEEAKQRGIDSQINSGDSSGWFTSRHQGNRHAAYKVLVDKTNGRILGAHVLGPHAEEVINVFTVAMRSGITASDLKEMRFAYPTSCSDISSML